MRPRHLVLLASAWAVLAASSAFAYSYGDTLTTIWRPLPNLPALVRPGDSFTVWANAPSTAGSWSASLQYGSLLVPLAPAGGGWQPTKSRWELLFTVPLGTPEEIYALNLSSDATAPDVAQHAVKVFPSFKSDYYFAQISDTHLPEHTFSDNGLIDPADTTGMADFDAVIEDLNVIHPEFIIHTGDLVNEGELEEYLGMYEMGRAQGMLNHLRDPIFVSTGNHDIGGWQPTPPPDGTSRKNWWRHYGWPFLGSPPPGDPYHSQDFTFDYGPLHVIGLEAYINSGSYDHYMPGIWGAQSFTAEQLSWLQSDIAAQPPGTHQLLFYHYDFGGTLANGLPGAAFSQINPSTLGLDGAIWGHNHGVAEGNLAARPFNLGLQSVIDRRVFRIFRVHNGVMTPSLMHRSGGISGTPDSLSLSWSGPNDGTRSRLTATVVNRFGESWEHARLQFDLVDHDSSFTVTGGTLAQVIRQGGIANVTVDLVLPAGGTSVVTVETNSPISSVPLPPAESFQLTSVTPNPYRALSGAVLHVRFVLPQPHAARVEVLDISGRVVAILADRSFDAGEQVLTWDGRTGNLGKASPGVYLVRLTADSRASTMSFVLAR